MWNKCSQSARNLNGIHCSSQDGNTITFLNYCLGFVREPLIDLCSHYSEAKACGVVAFPCVEIMLYSPLLLFLHFHATSGLFSYYMSSLFRGNETTYNFCRTEMTLNGMCCMFIQKEGNEKENISTEISMSVGGMLGQVTVWGLNHCWHLSDLINNQCAPLFPLDWPKCLHTNTRTSFTFT